MVDIMAQKPTYQELESKVQELERQKKKIISEEMKQNNEIHNIFMNSATDGFILFNSNMDVIDINKAAMAIFGVDNSVVGGNVTAISPDLKESGRYDQYMEVIKTGKPLFIENLISSSKLGRLNLSVKAFKAGDGLGTIITDITEQKKVEKSLQESRERYSRVLNTIQDGIAILNKKGNILFVNKTFSEIYKYPQEEIVGMNAMQLIHPDYHHVFKKYIRELETTGKFSGETIDVCKDGTTFFTEIKGARIDYKGQECLLAVVRDNSARKRYEDRLTRAAIEWESTFDATDSVIWLLDKEFRIIQSNRIAETFFNMSVDSMIGKHCWEIVHKTKEPITECPFSKAKISKEKESVEIQHGELWLEVAIHPVLDNDGKFEKVVHIITDITDRKAAELSLKESELLYRTLFNNNVSVMMLIDPKTSAIIDANPSACSYYGYSKEAITRMKISDINTLSKEELEHEIVGAASEHRNYFNFRHRLANGLINDVEVYSGPIKVRGRKLLCSIVHDISKRKALEVEREKLIIELKNALDEIKTLKGIVPICSSCKKIRDDKGYWNQLESYIEKHSGAAFSHGICPGCSDKLYGKEEWYRKMKQDKKKE
jgi:PAS domain S-box-containing protein